jgi:hypothetical protein
MRRAVEVLRGVSVRRWAIAVRLLQGDALGSVWGSHGAPPDPTTDALRILRQLERWATEERETEWEWRPRQWWDPPRRSNARPLPKSDAQADAERDGMQPVDGAATMTGEIEADRSDGTPDRSPASDAVIRSSSRPARSGARTAAGHPFPLEATNG